MYTKINPQRILIGICLMIGVLFCARNLIFSYLEEYAMNVAQEQFGSQRLAPAQEEKIANLAHEMGLTKPFTMRKMNRQALMTMGYWNAFAYFPVLFGFIPLSNKAFLFMSEGFFEDLSPEEQRFLIGHELTHIEENHTLYLNVITLFFICLLLSSVAYFLYAVWVPYITAKIPPSNQKLAITLPAIVLTYASLLGPGLSNLAYRRHMERVADTMALRKLKAYEGCANLLHRWQKDFSLPSENPYFGFFSDHPSCNERKLLCKNLQTTHKELV